MDDCLHRLHARRNGAATELAANDLYAVHFFRTKAAMKAFAPFLCYLVVVLSATARADIYRWDNFQLIPGF